MTAQPADVNVDDLRRRARRRLVGAIVIALAAAVFVPMLLESEPKPLGEDISVRIPPVDSGKFVNRLSEAGKSDAAKTAVPKGEAKAEAPRPEAPKADAPKAEPAKADAAKAEPAKAETPKAEAVPPANANANLAKGEAAAAAKDVAAPAAPRRSLEEAEQRVLAPAAKPPPSAPPPAANVAAMAPAPPPAAAAPAPAAPAVASPPKDDAGNGGFSVQLAAFADDKGANALANKLKKAGYAAYTEPLSTSRGTLWRVRVGPYPSRDAAVAARDKLKGEGHSGIVAAAK